MSKDGRVLPPGEAAELKELREILLEVVWTANAEHWYSEAAFLEQTLDKYCERYGYESRISAWAISVLCENLFKASDDV